MKKLSTVQIITLIAVLGYLVYELIFVRRWAAGLPESDPMIRVDLVIIYPILLILVGISLFQWFKRRKKT